MSIPKVVKDKDAGRKQFSVKEYKFLCDWCKIEGNLESILGTEGKTKVGGRYHTKKLAFEALAAYINERQFKGSDLAKVDWQGAKNRYNHLTGKYKRVKQLSETTGFGLTDQDEADGIQSIASKLEKLCPCFDRLDGIFGKKPKADIAGNLFTSVLMPDEDGTTPDNFLTQHDTTGTRDSPVVELMDVPDSLDGEIEPQPVSHSPIAQLPTSPMQTVQPVEANPRTGRESPPVERHPPTSDDSSPQSQGATRLDSSVRSKITSQKGPTNPTKKRPIEKNSSLTGTFAHNMETLSEGKLRSLEMKQVVMEQRAATQAIRAKTAQAQLQFLQQQLGLEAHRLRLEEKKMEQDAVAKEAKFEEGKRARKVQARLDVIKANMHRPPHELQEIIKMVENVD